MVTKAVFAKELTVKQALRKGHALMKALTDFTKLPHHLTSWLDVDLQGCDTFHMYRYTIYAVYQYCLAATELCLVKG